MLRKCGAGPTLKYSVLFSKENMRCEQVRGEGRPSYLLYFDNCACLRTRLRTRNQSIRRCVFILWVGHIHSGTDHERVHGQTVKVHGEAAAGVGAGGRTSDRACASVDELVARGEREGGNSVGTALARLCPRGRAQVVDG